MPIRGEKEEIETKLIMGRESLKLLDLDLQLKKLHVLDDLVKHRGFVGLQREP